jgi:hypothetical protein
LHKISYPAHPHAYSEQVDVDKLLQKVVQIPPVEAERVGQAESGHENKRRVSLYSQTYEEAEQVEQRAGGGDEQGVDAQDFVHQKEYVHFFVLVRSFG